MTLAIQEIHTTESFQRQTGASFVPSEGANSGSTLWLIGFVSSSSNPIEPGRCRLLLDLCYY
jgi:hypothetical protein